MRKIAVVLLVLLVGVSVVGCSKGLTPADKSWLKVRLDTPDYFWERSFNPRIGNFELYDSAIKRAREKSARDTGWVKWNIGQLERYHLLGPHPLVFNPLVSKGQKSDLSGSLSGGGNFLGGYVEGSVEGKSRPGVSYVFCWSLPQNQSGGDVPTFVSSLPMERVKVLTSEQGPPVVRFKYYVDNLLWLPSWNFENPGSLIDENRVLYATITISHEQLKQGYLSLR
ncbi:MAG: hypothetical protein WC080_04135 [Patescibacteria group bacterium]